MSMNIEPSQVYLGHWINWSYGAVRGATVTLTQQQGALLTALIAIFVGFAGTRIWIIICFMVHTSLSRDTPQDAIYHQRQVVFRNADNGSTGLWNLCMLVWAWRGLKGQVFRRLLPFIALSLVVTLAFTAAGIFSSTISAAGNEVLLTGAQCAIVRPTGQTTTANPSEEALDTAYWPFFHKLGKDNEERTLRCYTNSSTDDCSPTVVNKLAVMVDGNASCPFTHEICQDNTTSLMLETAYLNSNDDFGVNTPAAQRFSYRVRTQCSPLKLDGYTAIKHDLVAATDGSPNNITVAMMEFYYGEAFDLGQSANITYRYPVNYYNATPNGNQGRDYTLQGFGAYANNSAPQYSSFVTIPALTLEDADTSLFFLSANSILFSSLTDDPWYSAHQLSAVITGTSVAGSGEFKAYNADSAAVAVGCTSQYQACNPNKPTDTGCSPYLGQQQLSLWSNTSDAKALWGNNAQKELFMTAHEMLSNQITNLQGVPTVGSLTSLNSMNGGVQPALPTNQWQLEFENWFNIYLTSLQGAFINQANGPQGGPDFEQFLWRPAKGVDEEADSFDIMCKNQKIISTNYTSFSTLGLVLVFTIGGLFIILSFCLEPLVFWVVRKWKLGYSYALFEWSMNETLQLQSAMHEELGLGTWTRELGGVPVTKPGERLAIVDGRDMKRPRFAAPTPALGASTTFIDEKFNEK